MEADILKLYDSSICSVHNFLCRCRSCRTSKPEHSAQFSIAYVRRGNFQVNAFRRQLDAYHGLFLLNKPNYEYSVTHEHSLPDECTWFSVPVESIQALRSETNQLAWFLDDVDSHALLLRGTPGTEFLHRTIFQLLTKSAPVRLSVETLITELLTQIFSADKTATHISQFTSKQKRYYMPLVDNVKTYMNLNLVEDISLATLAQESNMSVFHFNRLFKKITGLTPYKYLLHLRLQHASVQITNTSSSITDIAFASGFASLEHFSASFKEHFGIPPSSGRRGKLSNFP